MAHEARLRCGHRLDYEADWLVPAPGELVPCRLHGHCPVEATHSSGRERVGRPRAQPSATRVAIRDDLLAVLQDQPSTTVHALRRRRFTLRVLVAAEADGLLVLDVLSGRVSARPGPPVLLDPVTGDDGRPDRARRRPDPPAARPRGGTS